MGGDTMNYLEISLLLRPETYTLCKEKLEETINKITDLNDLKLYATELNTFLYTTYIIKYQKDYLHIFETNRKAIFTCNGIDELRKVIINILDAYKKISDNILQNNDDVLIREVINEINENYYTKVTLKSIAGKHNVTENYLCRLFSEKTGYRFCDYINSLRVKKAEQLLVEGNKSLDYISDVCGFSSQSHFSVTFKKYYNISPGKYKLEAKNNKLKQIL